MDELRWYHPTGRMAVRLTEIEREQWVVRIVRHVRHRPDLQALLSLAACFTLKFEGLDRLILGLRMMAHELRTFSVPYFDIDKPPILYPDRRHMTFADDIRWDDDVGRREHLLITRMHVVYVTPAINACPLGPAFGTWAILEALLIVLAIADREAGAEFLDLCAVGFVVAEEKGLLPDQKG